MACRTSCSAPPRPPSLRWAFFFADGLIADALGFVDRPDAAVIAKGLTEMGIEYYGGTNSPYIWMRCPNGMASWDFFDQLLEHAQVVGTPGAGFGPAGEGYLRLSAFGQRPDAEEAIARMKEMLK